MITIVNYGMGNLGSIRNMFKQIGAAVVVADRPEEIEKAGKLLLPGVGAFDAAMARIESGGFRDILDRKVLEERIPILGICLGMQLLTRSSEEGKLPGLGWIDATTRRFPATAGLPVPHMGWNLARKQRECRLTKNLGDDARFYFVHSYYVRVANADDAILKTSYGLEFDSGVCHGNIYGAQFHPEKSHKFGMQLLRNFAEI